MKSVIKSYLILKVKLQNGSSKRNSNNRRVSKENSTLNSGENFNKLNCLKPDMKQTLPMYVYHCDDDSGNNL